MKKRKMSTLEDRMKCSRDEYLYCAAYAVLTEQITKDFYLEMKQQKDWNDILSRMRFVIENQPELEKFKNGDFTLYCDTYNFNTLPIDKG